MEIRSQSLSSMQNGREGSLHLAFILDDFAVGPRIRVAVKPWMAG